jgi:hypothetical protein
MAPDFLSTIRHEIDERLSELRPLLDERERLLEAAAALEMAGGTLGPSSESQKPPAPNRGRRAARIGSAQRGSAEGAIKLAAAGSAEGVLVKPVGGGSADNGSPMRLDGRTRSATRASRSVVSPKPGRATRSVARETILDALEHGSHTVGELTVVTAMSGPNINGSLRKLVAEGAVIKTEREGKAAWALPDAV